MEDQQKKQLAVSKEGMLYLVDAVTNNASTWNISVDGQSSEQRCPYSSVLIHFNWWEKDRRGQI